jgi:hypothetical protein
MNPMTNYSANFKREVIWDYSNLKTKVIYNMDVLYEFVFVFS